VQKKLPLQHPPLSELPVATEVLLQVAGSEAPGLPEEHMQPVDSAEQVTCAELPLLPPAPVLPPKPPEDTAVVPPVPMLPPAPVLPPEPFVDETLAPPVPTSPPVPGAPPVAGGADDESLEPHPNRIANRETVTA